MKTKPIVLVATAATVIICWISLGKNETDSTLSTDGSVPLALPVEMAAPPGDAISGLSTTISESFDYYSLSDVLGGMDARSQSFTIDPHKDCTVQAAGGAIVVIPAYSLVDESGKVPKGDVTITLSEYDDVREILAAKLQTKSEGRMLETAGMLHIMASDGDGELRIKEGASYEIRMPRRDTDTDYILFEGNRDEYDYMDWEVSEGYESYEYEDPDTGENISVMTSRSPELEWEGDDPGNELDLNCFIQVQSSFKRDLYYITKMDHYKWKFQEGGMDLNTYFVSNFNPDPEMLSDFCSNKLVCEIQLTLRPDGTIRHSYVTKTSKPEYDRV
ncbi:MAG: hypothetical protein RL220_689, partial [Bacteroidota bacterium]